MTVGAPLAATVGALPPVVGAVMAATAAAVAASLQRPDDAHKGIAYGYSQNDINDGLLHGLLEMELQISAKMMTGARHWGCFFIFGIIIS